MHIVYPEQMQFNVINDEEEELIGYAERCTADYDDVQGFGVMENNDMKNVRDLLSSTDEEYACKIVINNK